MILTDTDAVIDFTHGRIAQDGEFMRQLRADELAISSVSVFELLFGAHRRGRAEIEDFLARIHVLPVTERSARLAAAEGARLAGIGSRIAVPDLLIAGVALEHGLRLITRNVRQFGRLDGLALLDPN